MAQVKSRRIEALLTVVVVEYQAAFTPSRSKSGLFVLVLSLIWPAGRVSKLCQDIRVLCCPSNYPEAAGALDNSIVALRRPHHRSAKPHVMIQRSNAPIRS